MDVIAQCSDVWGGGRGVSTAWWWCKGRFRLCNITCFSAILIPVLQLSL